MSEAGWLLGSGLWVVGLALLLTVYGYRASDASLTRLGGVALPHWVLGGHLMVCLGFLLASRSGLERGGWGLLALLVLLRARAGQGRERAP